MLRYANTQVVFQEFPGETTFAINISGCPHRCPGCHSPYLWKNEGMPLTTESLALLIEPYKDAITCVGFMGGDVDYNALAKLLRFVRDTYPGIKIGWYSGNDFWTEAMMIPFDYVKFGSYKKDLGGLDQPTTNQVLFKHIHNGGNDPCNSTFDIWLNMTPCFWKDTPKDLKDIYIRTDYKWIASLNHILSQTSICTMVGVTPDGYETKVDPPTDENFVKGYIMNLNGQTPPNECSPQHFRRRFGEKTWERYNYEEAHQEP